MILWDDRAPRPGWQQMAIDRTLAARVAVDGKQVYRLYRWAAPTLSLGANESARRTWDRDALARAGVAVVRRPTGGRGVWHDPADLTYAVTAPLSAFGTLAAAYRDLHLGLAAGLGTVTANVSIAPANGRPTLAPGACFDLAVGGEILVAGRKTVGSAQALFGRALLQHGAIALADRTAALARFTLRADPADNGPSAVPWAPADATAIAIMHAWRDAGGSIADPGFTADVIDGSLAWRTQFDDPEWTWRR